MSVFGPVRALDVRSLAGPVVDVEVPAGTELVREGIPIGTFFVIRSGSVELFRDSHHVATLRTGDCFGEIDPDGDQPQAYGVITSAPTRLLTFSAFGISRLCEAIPGARERILAALPSAGGEVHSLPTAGGEVHSQPSAGGKVHSLPTAGGEVHSLPSAAASGRRAS